MFVTGSWFHLYILGPVALLMMIRIVHNYLMLRKWARGENADLEEFGGVYTVYMLPRFLFFWFRNQKFIEGSGNLVRSGHNLAFWHIKWGSFTAVESVRTGVRLIYSVLIVDLLKRIAPGVYLGKFYLRFGKFKLFVFWFILQLDHEATGEDMDWSKVSGPGRSEGFLLTDISPDRWDS